MHCPQLIETLCCPSSNGTPGAGYGVQDATIADARIKAEDDAFSVHPALREEGALVDLTDGEPMEVAASEHEELHSFEIDPVKVSSTVL